MSDLQRSPFHGAVAILLVLFLCNNANAKHSGYLEMASQFMAPQNAARAAVGVPPLVWDMHVAHYAAMYANKRRSDCALEHSYGPYGENIATGGGTHFTPAEAAIFWVSEREFYNYGKNSCAQGEECGHYTQIVSKGTRRVGCARVICNGGSDGIEESRIVEKASGRGCLVAKYTFGFRVTSLVRVIIGWYGSTWGLVKKAGAADGVIGGAWETDSCRATVEGGYVVEVVCEGGEEVDDE
ncbi:hypothetical protein HHK36_021162 [Tetracentron sinense]|uniref:SCP domain-containing protein n=1 Tax=Tetracentron sinense TaxID=13715 RepID=A0A834YR03_TETSI|nr:hypothetical protein HHK36_021162 [Tetracentron sinense]